MTKTALYAKNFVAMGQSSYILQAWCGDTWEPNETTFDVRVWAYVNEYIPAYGWRLYKLYDPITQQWGRTELTTEPIMSTSSGYIADPWFRTTLPVYRTDTPLEAGHGYILELAIPEPSSLLALTGGLAVIGFRMRRRR